MAKLIDRSFWSDKRVFLTGHTGFKGSWLGQWLCDKGAVVRGYGLAPFTHGVPEGYAPLYEELGLAERMEHEVAEIRDRASVSAALKTFRPNVVIHMAAQSLVRPSYRQPVETYETNVMGTVNVLDACRNSPDLRAVCVVTSDKCYENREQIWGYRETDAMGGHDPYSNSKGCAELATAAYRNSFFPPSKFDQHGVVVCSGRAGNVVGGGDWSVDRLVPDAMRAYVSGETIVLRNPDSVRPWQHVIDPISGYLALVEACYDAPEIAPTGWNFGPPETSHLAVGDVVAALGAELGDRLNFSVETALNQPHEARLLKLDCTAARELLGWEALFSAPEMLSMTAAWYLENDPAARRALVGKQLVLADSRRQLFALRREGSPRVGTLSQ